MNDILRFSAPAGFETRALDDSGFLAGYASTFGGEPDSYGDLIAPGAFIKSLGDHGKRGTMPAMLWSHEASEPVGRWTQMSEDSRGLLATGKLNLKTTRGREAYEHLRAGDVTGLSIGFRVDRDGASYEGRTRVLKSVALHEVSLVALPANQNARVVSVKSLGGKPTTLRELETALRELGFTKSEAKAIAAHGFQTDIPDDELLAVQGALKSLASSLDIKV